MQQYAGLPGVVSVFRSRSLHLHTTRSWDFLGVTKNVKRNPSVESDVIIGVIDSGICPESPSFSDEGFGPLPKNWKGECAGGDNFTCNRKLIGARFYAQNDTSARDGYGHGVHTASIAAGNRVPSASFFGIAEGIATGGVPSARISVYKVCDARGGCQWDDFLAGFDDAIADGVDIIMCPLGTELYDLHWLEDPVAIGTFHAMENSILTVHSAGNRGPSITTIASTVPWLITVAATNTDRSIVDKFVLGNGTTVVTVSNHFNVALIVSQCDPFCLDEEKVKGKIVVCDNNPNSNNRIDEALRAGAAGAILLGTRNTSSIAPFPASSIRYDAEYTKMQLYFFSTNNPEGTILKSESTIDSEAPTLTTFSSRGPNLVAPEILKPDITAPGIDILAAFCPEITLSGYDFDKRRSNYFIMSGTSMSASHVAGAAAYVKTFHPDWSPSAIKSALMTTAWPMKETQGAYDVYGVRDHEFAYGAGNLNPVKATDPGLVYEATKDDFLAMMCSMNLTFFGKCPKHIKLGSPKDLNYPAMTVQVKSGKDFEIKFPRTVTNVGLSNSTYKATLLISNTTNPYYDVLKASVEPRILSFKSLDEKKSFVVTVAGKFRNLGALVSASLVWSDGTHNVRSPITVYIVYMGSLPAQIEYSPQSHHISILQEVVHGRSATDSLVRSYKRSFNGFAAKLTGMHGVVSVYPSKMMKLQTTRSWDFMGVTENAKRNPSVESDVIIGMLDEGIWPELPSFTDEGFSPPPKKWKGECAGGNNFTCNRKVIGARVYIGADARDDFGHGCHTSSIAAGNKVPGASFYGIAKGNARGGVPSARIAAYKVCDDMQGGCPESAVLAGFDDAIADGADILSCSFVGNDFERPWEQETLFIGAFHAMENGILTVNGAGNAGPAKGTMPSTAPWLFSVAASSTDRHIIDKIVLGNGKTFIGKGINSFELNGTKFPLTYGDQSPGCFDGGSARNCSADCLDRKKVKGKIVLCDHNKLWEPYSEAYAAGATGLITTNPEVNDLSSFSVDPLPASTLWNIQDFDAVMSYYNSTNEAIKDSDAPLIAYFSSRGPNRVAPEILKPDIAAPGLDILAAFVPNFTPSSSLYDKRRTKFNIMAGTSMACPHVTGAAAYVKTFHPDWSPSAIKSALMTTAWSMNETKHPDREFAYGAGHLNPVKATDPGLVYETTKEDYLAMMCSMNHTFFGKCPKHIKLGSPKDLNYPSMAVQVHPGQAFEIKFPRTVTNVGLSHSTYKATILTSSTSKEVKASVEPSTLSFTSLDEKKSFAVTVAGKSLPENSMVSASLVWSDGVHNVRSPIVVYTDL
ncbi:hypothetical protein Ddye_014996 [Dipteronia dyeriana]|uniref:Uncharacterized protein n=1 Tax=Dipteronia dyeriana TaxID=168575 RepID=A0AAD9WYX4_9ROSI|nr:hypothetical protein Ddye_014996 [Dipteronia dyeriana]